MSEGYERLPFAEAIEWFSQKTNLDTDSWIEGQGIVQDAAFTVAAAKGALLQEIRDAVAKGQSEGKSVQAFLKDFDAIADRYVNNWNLKGDRAWRGQLIYEQNLRNAYQAGRYAQMTRPDVMKLRPYWQWQHGDSRAPRPAHLALDGRVFRADDLPFMPPAGFNCRCQVFSLSQRDVDRRGLKIEDWKRGDEVEVVDPSSGSVRTIALNPDKGFENALGKSTTVRRREVLENILRNKDLDIQASARSEAMPVRLRTDRLQQRRSAIVEVAGERLVRDAERAVQQALASARVYIQAYPDALEQIITSGRFKSAFELNQFDLDAIEVRRTLEEMMYGYPAEYPTDRRPVSGFLATSSKLNEAPLIRDFNAYGTVSIELHRSVKNKASFTLDDSLTPPNSELRGKEISWQPSELLGVNISSIVSLKDDRPELVRDRVAQFAKVKTIDDIQTIKKAAYENYDNYLEVGLHGSVASSTIARILYRYESPSEVVSQWAKVNNVAIEVRDRE